jgi:hypothetical protein
LNKQNLLNLFENKFRAQLKLEISDVLFLENDQYILKMDQMALSIGSLKLELSDDEHIQMAEFLSLVQKDNDSMFEYNNI